jgi:predicted RNA-binding Zn ribbon-like protein
VPRYDVPKAAPAPLALVQRLVNSIDLERDHEWLASPADLTKWLKEARLEPPSRVTAADVRRAQALREAFRLLLAANNRGEAPPADALATVNRTARTGRVALELAKDGQLVVRAHAEGMAGALGAVVAVAFEAMLDGRWQRLKACRNCRWAFYDYSRNRVASWCSMSLCGNRLKTRRYRKRKAARGAERRTPQRRSIKA